MLLDNSFHSHCNDSSFHFSHISDSKSEPNSQFASQNVFSWIFTANHRNPQNPSVMANRTEIDNLACFFLNKLALIKETGTETLKKKVLFYHTHYESTNPLNLSRKSHFKKRNHVCVSVFMFHLFTYTVSNKIWFFFSFQSLFFFFKWDTLIPAGSIGTVHHDITHAFKQKNDVYIYQFLTSSEGAQI